MAAPLQLCLVRHAIAEERGTRWPDDSLRPLTAEGRAKMEEAAKGLLRLIDLQAVLTSPYTRARETALILAEAAGGIPVIATPALVSGDDAALLAAARDAGVVRVAAVGHEPTISASLSNLVAGDPDAFAAPFKKGGAALVVYEGGPGRAPTLAWFLPPAALRVIGRVNDGDA